MRGKMKNIGVLLFAVLCVHLLTTVYSMAASDLTMLHLQAEQGDTKAQAILGSRYDLGDGVAQELAWQIWEGLE